jgi:iron complex transport system substrate-binding protein
MTFVARLGLALALLASTGRAASLPASAQPQRIVSLNLCIDQILVDLVPRSRIAAVTHLATDPAVSAAPEKARGLPVTHGAAEDVLSRNPDLVLASAFSAAATVDLLRRLGLNVVLVPLPQDYEGVRAVVRQIAEAVGESARGDIIIADFDKRLAAASASSAASARRPIALVYQVNSYVASTGGLASAALKTAGFRNGAAALANSERGQVAMETIAMAAPDVLILTAKPDEYATAVSDNLRHPALAKLMANRTTTVLPWPVWLCGTPAIAEAVEQLASVRASLPEHPTP